MNLFAATEGATYGFMSNPTELGEAITDHLWALYYSSLGYWRVGGERKSHRAALAWRKTTVLEWKRSLQKGEQ